MEGRAFLHPPLQGRVIAYEGLRTPSHAGAQSISFSCDRNQSLVSCLTAGVQSDAVQKIFGKKYNRSTMENVRQLQCKVLRRREKSRLRRNNGAQWKKQYAEQRDRRKFGRMLTHRPVISTPTNRDRGASHDAAPPTPPDIRVRIRRFGDCAICRSAREGRPSEPK